MSSEQSTQKRQKMIDGMRQFADWLEAHPDARPPQGANAIAYHACASMEEMRAMARRLGGTWEKQADEYTFDLVQTIGGFRYLLFTSRSQVCTARQVTKTEVKRERDPEVVAAALAAIPEVERVVETQETVWDCPESLLAEGYDESRELLADEVRS